MFISYRKMFYSLILGTLILLSMISPTIVHASSFTSPTNTIRMAQNAAGPNDSAELEGFLDNFFTENMEEMNIPGAAFVMVKDGGIFLTKGYGYADLENEIPVDPERTIFHVGSVSKLFTCTAAMQMVEQELLELDTDVNHYITEFQIPATYETAITLNHLMTHTAGFEDRWIGTLTHDENEAAQFNQYMASNIPDRVVEPGTMHIYSNYSASLVGYLVEQVSGRPFSEYIDVNMFQPLEMLHSTFQQPIPESLVANLAVGYDYKGGSYHASTPSYDRNIPAGSMSTTAIDMAAFMIAHLQDGQYGSARILQANTAQQMHQQQFSHHPELPGMAYGFKERYINGQRVIGHGGDTEAFASQMILLPEQNTGFFIAYNSFSDAFREDFIRTFFDRYYPSESEDISPNILSMTEKELARFGGSYRWLKYPHSTMGKLIAFLPGPYNLKIAPDNDSLSVTFFGVEDVEWRYAPIEPLVFKQISGGLQVIEGLKIDLGDTLVFRENEENQITNAFFSIQNTAFEKLSWYESPESMLGTFGVLIFMSLFPLILWLIIGVVRRVRKSRSSAPAGSKWARWLAVIVSGLNLTFLIGLFLTFGEELLYGTSTVITGLLVLPIITGILTPILLVMAIVIWAKGYWSLLGRAHFSLISLAAVAFIMWAYYWNLIEFL